MVEQPRNQVSEMHFDRVPDLSRFQFWKTSFKTEVCSCTSFPTNAKLWNKEVEMVESVDDLDVTRTTHRNLDVLQESRSDDHWNVDVDRNLSNSWIGFTKFTILIETPPKGEMWSWRRLAKIQATVKPDHLWQEIWSTFSKAAQRKEKQQWVIEKPKLHNARKLRGIYSIDPDDGLLKETVKKQLTKLEIPMEAAMLCKQMTKKCPNKLRETDSETKGSNNILNPKHACIVEAVPDAQAAVDKVWEKLEKLLAWQLTTVKAKRRLSWKHKNGKEQSILPR